MDLSNEEIVRYSRHLLLPEIGLAGQRRLKTASILCVGAGGLGSPAAMYLAAAGVGHLGIVDADRVEESNLQRQLLHGTADIGRPKAESAFDRLRAINPNIEITPHSVRLSAANASELIVPYDIVLDGTDNFSARFLINDACVLLGRPNVYGAVFRFEGQASVFAPKQGGPCYRCLYPEPPPPSAAPSCAEAGVLGVVPGILGCIQAAEAIKLALGIGESLIGRLLLLEVLSFRYREVKVRRDPGCPVCGDNPTIKELKDLDYVCAPVAPETGSLTVEEISVQELQRVLQCQPTDTLVLDVREESEAAIAAIPGAQLFPLSGMTSWVQLLNPTGTYLIYCKTGRRSLQAAEFLRQRGFRSVKSVRGGILAWADEVDRSLSKY